MLSALVELRRISSLLSTFSPPSFISLPPPLFSPSFESPANNVSVCCMLPWLFLEPAALRYLPVRLTLGVEYISVDGVLHLKEKTRQLFFGSCLNMLVNLHFYFLFLLIFVSHSGSQQPPGGFRAAPGLFGGQEDKGIECRH